MRAVLVDLGQRLLSRKLWVAVISAAYFGINNDPTQAMAVIIAYVGIQGHVDAQAAKEN